MYSLLSVLVVTSSSMIIYNSYKFLSKVIKNNDERTVYILRGLPGSGKNCYIQNYIKFHNLKEDKYVICGVNDILNIDNKNYKYNPRNIPKAYSYCFDDFFQSLTQLVPYIFVNNVNSQGWEYINYINLAKYFNYKVKIIEIGCPTDHYIEYFNKRSVSKEPLSTSRSFYDRWENDKQSFIVDPYESDHEGDSLPYPKVSLHELDRQLDSISKYNLKLTNKKYN